MLAVLTQQLGAAGICTGICICICTCICVCFCMCICNCICICNCNCTDICRVKRCAPLVSAARPTAAHHSVRHWRKKFTNKQTCSAGTRRSHQSRVRRCLARRRGGSSAASAAATAPLAPARPPGRHITCRQIAKSLCELHMTGKSGARWRCRQCSASHGGRKCGKVDDKHKGDRSCCCAYLGCQPHQPTAAWQSAHTAPPPLPAAR